MGQSASIRRIAAVATVAAALLSPLAAPARAGGHPEHGEPESGLVQSLVPGGAAEAAGVRVGDRIVELDGKAIVTPADLRAVIGAHQPGDEVRLIVVRDGARHELELTFGTRPGGGPSLGVTLALMQTSPAGDGDAGGTAREHGSPSGVPEGPPEGKVGREECVAWIDSTYRVEAMIARHELDLVAEHEAARACLVRDLGRMATPIPYGWCDNVFKVHCAGLDLLTEIGEAQVDWCADRLSETSGDDVRDDEAWTCAAERIFERYSTKGRAADEDACRSILRECAAVDRPPAPPAPREE